MCKLVQAKHNWCQERVLRSLAVRKVCVGGCVDVGTANLWEEELCKCGDGQAVGGDAGAVGWNAGFGPECAWQLSLDLGIGDCCGVP